MRYTQNPDNMVDDTLCLDLIKYREEIPVTRKWIYLRHCNRGPLPKRSFDVLADYLRDQMLSAGANSSHWFDLAEQARGKLAAYLNTSARFLAFTKNATEALSVLLQNYKWRPGHKVLTSSDEYPQYIRCLKKLRQKGVNVDILDDSRRIINSIDERTDLVLMSHVSWRTGNRIPLAKVVEVAKRHNAILVVDTVQSLGVFRIPVPLADIDFFIGNSRKWLLGLDGIGFLYINPKHLERFSRLCDRTIAAEREEGFLNIEKHYLRFDARKLEPGCNNTAAMLALGASLDFILDVGPNFIERRVLDLMEFATSYAIEQSLKVLSSTKREEMSGLLVVELDSVEQRKQMMTFLRSHRVLVSGYLNKVILAIHFFNSENEIMKVLTLITKHLKELADASA